MCGGEKEMTNKKNTDPPPMTAEEDSGGDGGCTAGEGKGSPAPTKSGGGGAAKFLAGMPSRGNFSSGSVSSSLVRTPPHLHAEIPELFHCFFLRTF
jgi:hypothetical protein